MTYNPRTTNIKILLLSFVIYHKDFRRKALYDGCIKATIQSTFIQTTANDINLKSTVRATSSDIENKHQIRVNCFHPTDGAMEVARYILDEIRTNDKSLVADMIRYHIEETLSNQVTEEFKRLDKIVNYNPEKMREHREPNYLKGLLMWVEQVAPNKPWDHKPLIRERLFYAAVHRPLRTGTWSETYYHRYKNYDYYLDIWSNIHYGYIGRSVGFSRGELLTGSDLQQKFKDLSDKFSINKWLHSITVPKEFNPPGDTKDDQTAIEIGMDLYEKYPGSITASIIMNKIVSKSASEFPKSKDKHYCLG